MSIDVRPLSSGPVNRAAFKASLFGCAAWNLWHAANAHAVLFSAASVLCAGVAASSLIQALKLLAKDYKLRRDLAKAQTASDDHGTGREADWIELAARAMDDPASGNLLGLYQEKHAVFVPPKTPFCIFEAPPGAGKTTFLVLGSILHQARLGRSLFIADPKAELAPMLVESLRSLGFETWCVNPAKLHLVLCGDTELNLFQSVVDACHDNGPFRRDVIKLALDLADLLLPEPKGDADKNVFFRNGSRRCLVIAILSQALMFPAHCTPSDVFTLLTDPKAFKKRLLDLRFELPQRLPDDPVVAFLAGEAANLLEKFECNAEHADSFMEGATQTLIAFNQGGRMAGFGRTATVNIADLRKRPIIVFVMSPLSHARDFAPVVSLLNHSLLEAVKRIPNGHPVHVVGEEFLNYRFADIAGTMETLRGLKLSMDIYIQSFDGLVRKIGREAAAAVESYSDVKLYLGTNAYHRAKHVSDMLAEATIRRQDYAFGADARAVSVNSRELGRRVMMPDEILAMPRNQAWAFVRGLRPVKLTMIDYGRGAPWRDEVAANPLEGAALRGDPIVKIHYPGKGEAGKPVLINAPKPPKAKRRDKGPRFVWPARPRHLLWFPPAVALWLAVPLYASGLPLPHLMTNYDAVVSSSDGNAVYRRCAYVGPYSRTITPPDGRCPLIAFFPKN